MSKDVHRCAVNCCEVPISAQHVLCTVHMHCLPSKAVREFQQILEQPDPYGHTLREVQASMASLATEIAAVAERN